MLKCCYNLQFVNISLSNFQYVMAYDNTDTL